MKLHICLLVALPLAFATEMFALLQQTRSGHLGGGLNAIMERIPLSGDIPKGNVPWSGVSEWGSFVTNQNYEITKDLSVLQELSKKNRRDLEEIFSHIMTKQSQHLRERWIIDQGMKGEMMRDREQMEENILRGRQEAQLDLEDSLSNALDAFGGNLDRCKQHRKRVVSIQTGGDEGDEETQHAAYKKKHSPQDSPQRKAVPVHASAAAKQEKNLPSVLSKEAKPTDKKNETDEINGRGSTTKLGEAKQKRKAHVSKQVSGVPVDKKGDYDGTPDKRLKNGYDMEAHKHKRGTSSGELRDKTPPLSSQSVPSERVLTPGKGEVPDKRTLGTDEEHHKEERHKKPLVRIRHVKPKIFPDDLEPHYIPDGSYRRKKTRVMVHPEYSPAEKKKLVETEEKSETTKTNPLIWVYFMVAFPLVTTMLLFALVWFL